MNRNTFAKQNWVWRQTLAMQMVLLHRRFHMVGTLWCTFS